MYIVVSCAKGHYEGHRQMHTSMVARNAAAVR